MTAAAGATGAGLLRALRRRFVTETDAVSLGGVDFDLTRPRDAESLISEDEFLRDERLPYWAHVWPSAFVLAERLAAERGGGATLLELGCGVGLVTLSAMHAGYAVTATDYYQDALRFTRANAWRAFGREPSTRLVDWRTLPNDLGTYDRVVAADVLYERSYGALVAETIARTLDRRGEATVADPERVAASAFLETCAKVGLGVRPADPVPFGDAGASQTVRLYSVCWAAGR